MQLIFLLGVVLGAVALVAYEVVQSVVAMYASQLSTSRPANRQRLFGLHQHHRAEIRESVGDLAAPAPFPVDAGHDADEHEDRAQYDAGRQARV